MRFWLSATLVLAGITAALAVEPSNPDQIVPAAPQLQFVGNDDFGVPVFLETTTLGRVVDTGYVWQVSLAKDGNGVISWIRLAIDCPIQTVTQDWVAYFDTGLTLLEQHPDAIIYQAGTPLERQIVATVCEGFPLAPEPVLQGMAGLVAWIAASPATTVSEPPREPDPDVTPPTVLISLLEVFSEPVPPMTAFLEENWISRAGEDALTWQFFVFTPPGVDHGQEVIGGWYRIRYHCAEPRTAVVSQVVPVAPGYTLLPARSVDTPARAIGNDTPDRPAADIACGYAPPPADQQRFATMGEAVRAAQ
jgi:hypothetical protein